ncbi:ThuA domain-containing protein [Actinoplanes regularis]
MRCWTGARFTEEQKQALVERVRAGAGFAGWNGGIVATGYEAPRNQFMVGGRLLCRPGGFVDINPQHPLGYGLSSFDLHTEQYFTRSYVYRHSPIHPIATHTSSSSPRYWSLSP